MLCAFIVLVWHDVLRAFRVDDLSEMLSRATSKSELREELSRMHRQLRAEQVALQESRIQLCVPSARNFALCALSLAPTPRCFALLNFG